MAWTNGDTRTSTTQWKTLRRQAKQQLPDHCANCGDTEHLELDHKVPHFQGGADTIDNLQWLCKPCHRIKTNEEARRARGGHYKRPQRPNIGTVRVGDTPSGSRSPTKS